MDQDRLKEILEKSRRSDLPILIKAREEAKRALSLSYSPQNLKAYERIDKKINELVEGQRVFASRREALVYLQEQGYKVSKSKLYGDVKKGLLRVERDGSVTMNAVKSYITHPLARLSDGSEFDKTEKLALERLAADTNRIKAQAEHWHIKNMREKGLLVWRSEFERALAARAIRLKEDLRNFARGEAPEIVKLCDGKDEKINEVMNFMLDKIEEYLGVYAEKKEL